ncbi:MAG: pyruvate kinase [Bacteriovoracaceae bacterium]|jgi:pyruvate kinase|nr:pyruvate kinase [Bacteriovoracaceae bacterium]
MRRAKIIATLGPSSNTQEKIEKLIEAGMNVARINMSHGTHENHGKVIKHIRAASSSTGYEVAIMADLQGPKIRVDKLKENFVLKAGETWVIGESRFEKNYSQYKDKFIPTIYENLVNDCHDGARILFDDGLLAAKALTQDGDVYKIEILTGGILKSNKGINLPDCDVSAPAFTEKDKKDLIYALSQDVDYVALSFVRTKKDISDVKKLLHTLKSNLPIVAKIEKPQAVNNLDEILTVADLIMVARGDMGVEVGNHLVPSIQKHIIRKCRENHIPVITATQMLESMTENPTPTRAEASDVANAIWDGTDIVMLSGETAAGKYPIVSIQMMDQIIIEAEKTPTERPFLRNMDLSNVNSSVMVAASMMAEKVRAKRILSVTESGNSCKKISAFRPQTPVLGITNSLHTARRLCMYWGVSPYYIHEFDEDNFDFQVDVINKVKKERNFNNGDKIVITRGDGKFFSRGSSNSVKIEILNDMNIKPGSGDQMVSISDEKKQINLDTNICASCQNCTSVCPHDIWGTDQKHNHLTTLHKENLLSCTMDLECVEKCPTGAIEIIPRYS